MIVNIKYDHKEYFMIQEYKGHYPYTQKIVSDWNSTVIGVYYLGYVASDGGLKPLYIGKAVADGGIRGRLLQHLQTDRFADVTHFGYQVCSTAAETDGLEARKIQQHQPKYNKVGKYN